MSSIPSISIYGLFEERLSQLQDSIRNYDGEPKEGKSLWRELKIARNTRYANDYNHFGKF